MYTNVLPDGLPNVSNIFSETTIYNNELTKASI